MARRGAQAARLAPLSDGVASRWLPRRKLAAVRIRIEFDSKKVQPSSHSSCPTVRKGNESPGGERKMINLALHFIQGFGDDFSTPGLWMFLSIGTVSLFVVFIPLVSWIESRRKEREAFYKADTMRRLVESSGEGAKVAIQLMREEERLKRIKAREGLKAGGVINICVGAALVIFMRFLLGSGPGSP